jgi:hypothetical protein
MVEAGAANGRRDQLRISDYSAGDIREYNSTARYPYKMNLNWEDGFLRRAKTPSMGNNDKN